MRVWVLPIEGTIEPGLAVYVRRVVSEAEAQGGALLLLELNTFGGRLDAATEIRDAIISSSIPTAAFVTERAISAGALITLAADQILMRPGATIGAAEPRPLDEKTLSYVRAEFEATAERLGRDSKVAAAMVDASVEIEGLVSAGQILTLTTSTALQYGYADQVVNTRAQALDFLGYVGAEVVETEPNWAESLVRFLTDPTVAQILLILGVLGLIAELSSPGWGVPGTVGLVALGLFFGSRLIVGILGVEAILLFLLGLILLAVELFLIPGFGVTGLLGLGAIGTSLFLSFPDPRAAIQAMAITALAVLVTVLIFLNRFQRSALWGRLILRSTVAGEEQSKESERHSLLGAEGVARTPLRPSGKVEVNGELIDAVSEAAMISQGSRVRVIKVESLRIVVREIHSE